MGQSHNAQQHRRAHLGQLDATITRASLDGVNGKVTFDEANFIVAGVPVAQVRPSVLAISRRQH